MHPKNNRLSLALLLILLAPAASVAQDPTGTPFEEELDVTEVLLDVVVTDRRGTPIPGLTAEDFVVTEDGEAVDVTSVEYYTTRYGGPEAELALEPGEVPASRYFVFFFDDQSFNQTPENRLMSQQIQAGKQAMEWARESLQPSDWVAVLGYRNRLQVHLDFTQDREAITEALEAASLGRAPRAEQPGPRRAIDSTAPSLLAQLPTGRELRRATPTQYAALTRVAEALGPIAARKNLLLLSIGFGQFDSFTGMARGDERFYPGMVQALNDNNVAVYTIDISPTETRRHAQENFLSQLAPDTGARYFSPSVHFATPLAQVAEETTGYYVLSYRAERPRGKSGYQRVRVDTQERGHRVRARQGYRFGDAG